MHPIAREGGATAVAWLVAWAVLLAGCAVGPSRYDAISYRNLTGLKAQTMTVVEAFDTTPVEQSASRIEALRLSYRKVYEYERGKGEVNRDTVAQVEEIGRLLEQIVTEYNELGPRALGPRYFREAAVVIGQAFDIAIATENAKNPATRGATR